MKKLVYICLMTLLIVSGCSKQSDNQENVVNTTTTPAVTTTTTAKTEPPVTSTTPVETEPVVTTTPPEITTTVLTTTTPVVTTTVATTTPVVTTKPVETTEPVVTTTTVKPVVTTTTTTTKKEEPKPSVGNFSVECAGKEYTNGQTVNLEPNMMTDFAIYGKKISVTSSNPSVLTVLPYSVTGDGVGIETKAEGTATVTITYNGQTITLNVQVGSKQGEATKPTTNTSSDWIGNATEAELKQAAKQYIETVNAYFASQGDSYRYEWNEFYYEAALAQVKQWDKDNKYQGHYNTREWIEQYKNSGKMDGINTEAACIQSISTISELADSNIWKTSAGHWDTIRHLGWDGIEHPEGNSLGVAYLYDHETGNLYMYMIHD